MARNTGAGYGDAPCVQCKESRDGQSPHCDLCVLCCSLAGHGSQRSRRFTALHVVVRPAAAKAGKP